jgi:excisionase family DNA binding protein
MSDNLYNRCINYYGSWPKGKALKISDLNNQQQPELPRLSYTRREAAKVAGISLSTLDRETKANRIPHKRVRDRVLYPKAAFIKWCSSGDSGTAGMEVAA